ncbi:hypothetical protein LCGC14_2179630, partial [marine sediment metagenome]
CVGRAHHAGGTGSDNGCIDLHGRALPECAAPVKKT